MNPGEREDEAWMALPLFNREDSPVEQSRNVLLLSTEATMADLAGDGLDGLDLYDVPVTASRADSGCESAGWMEASYDESNDIVWLEPASEGNQIDSQQPGGGGGGGGGGGEQEQEQIGCTPSTCPFPGCKSTLQFARARDFRRHYKQHFKRFFCRHPGCPRSEPMTMTMTMTTAAGVDSGRGFATRKDRARHEARHNPGIRCPWHDGHGEQCPRMFSRTDNMRDHVRRIHMSS